MNSEANNSITYLDELDEWDEWVKYGHDLIKDSSKKQDEIAKYFIGLVSGIITIYTVILTFFGLSQITDLTIVIVMPLIFIIISLGLSLLVFKPQMKEIPLDDPVGIMGMTAERNRIKYYYLSAGIVFFVIGIFSIPFVIGIGSIYPQENIQLIVFENKQPLLETIPITFESNTLKTVPLKLVKQDDKKVVVILENGNIAELSKDWIEVIIYTKS